MSTAKITATARYLTFRIGDEVFAINVTATREVLDVSHITRLPTAPHYLRGVVNVRGNSIPVVDLRLKFGLPSVPDTLHTRIIVMDLRIGDETVIVGGLADSVQEVIELEPQEINDPPSLGLRWRTDLILGLGRRKEGFIIILDIERVFASEDLLQLTAVAAPAA